MIVSRAYTYDKWDETMAFSSNESWEVTDRWDLAQWFWITHEELLESMGYEVF